MATSRGQRQECAAAAINDASDFTDAFMVPELARACCVSSGLKNLRHVCKGLKGVLQGSIRGYTLTLGAEAQQNLEHVLEFLKGVNLKSLLIVFPHSGKPMAIAMGLAMDVCSCPR